MIWTSIMIASACFIGAFLWAQWWKQRVDRNYPLPPSKYDKPTVELDEGTPVSNTPDGKRWQEIANGSCPHCHDPAARFREGPSGGMSVNIQCVGCGWWFNVTPVIGIAQDIGRRD